MLTNETQAPTNILRRRARILAGATIGWNVVEAVVAISAGIAAGSVALVGFGIDSTIEVSASVSVLWLLAGSHDERRERLTSRAIAVSFAALAVYVAVEAVISLAGHDRPHHSTVGIVLAALSLVVMPGLAIAKRRTGRAMGSGSVVADGTQTLLCSYLSAALLLGLVLNTALGWWWADALAGLVIAAVAAREARETWNGDDCC
jgi:divalent metal cation (Fe/Co/Zn/Cd) transporter